jgi:8-oxo-dGTP pyrophosphatase MutT (NUDIX family)
MQPTFIQQIKQRLQQPLPGLDAQTLMMADRFRQKDSNAYVKPSEGGRKAGVMLLLFQKGETWYTALMQRPDSPYAHSRQISFPGGGLEDEDVDLAACAKRETEEEFGIPREDIQLLGALSELYIPVSRYLVQPFVGYLEAAPSYTPDPNEVDEIIEVPLEDLLNPALHKLTEIKTSSGLVMKDIPYFDVAEKKVWGATAMMLSEFVYLVEQMRVD